jgi:deazaflavin-dependent oxidoreductase (nitroreductase family)
MVSGRSLPGWLRVLFGAPRLLYEHRLGWVLGHRFLCLSHVGRRSGRKYRTVLEVIWYEPERPRLVVMSGFGEGADWLLNLQAAGFGEVETGRWRFVADHHRLAVDEAARVLAAYERRNRWLHPILRAMLSRLLGWPYDGSAAARRRAVEQLPLIEFVPRTEARRPH